MVKRRGFTLVELLVVLGIIALLIAILMPTLQKAREAAYKLKCAANQRAILQACAVYSGDDKAGIFLFSWEPGGGNDCFYALFGFDYNNLTKAPVRGILKDYKAFVCPSTMNTVTERIHLIENARNGNTTVGGHSYESRGFLHQNGEEPENGGKAWYWPDGKQYFRERDASKNLYTWPNPKGRIWKNSRQMRDTSTLLLITDADDVGINNWPEQVSNHMTPGWNMGFADTHVEWTLKGKDTVRTFLFGYYMNIPLTTIQANGGDLVSGKWIIKQ